MCEQGHSVKPDVKIWEVVGYEESICLECSSEPLLIADCQVIKIIAYLVKSFSICIWSVNYTEIKIINNFNYMKRAFSIRI